MNRHAVIVTLALGLTLQTTAGADIVSSSDSHYVLRHEAASSLAPDALWQRLIDPASWWHPDHTYSGDANNLTLELEAGGHWREDWDGNSVAHGRVLYVDAAKRTLRMDAPFGPLQGMGAYTVWTITISPIGDDGSLVVFDETSIAPPTDDMEAIAQAVDSVKSVAIRLLAVVPDGS